MKINKMDENTKQIEDAQIVTDNIKEDLAQKITTDGAAKEATPYEYAHLCLKCSCGSNYIIDKDVKGGIRIDLPTNDVSAVKLVCRDCGHEMELYYRESSKKDDKEVATEPSTEKQK